MKYNQTNLNLRQLIMKLEISVLIICLSISSLFAGGIYSQSAKVSLDMQKCTLEQVMDEIEKQSEFYFIFNQKQIDINRKIDIKAENKLITDVLPLLFAGTNVNYYVFDRKILLSTDPIDKDLVSVTSTSNKSNVQQQVVTGKVTDSETGEPLPGVNVVVKGTTIGTTTDIDGSFSLNVPDFNVTLIFSFVGYAMQEIPLAGRTNINVNMASEKIGLEEVVVIGYGIQNKSDVTGAITSVKSDQIVNRSVENIGQAIQGKVSGVQVLTLSAAPGASPVFRVRGYSSNGSSDPLYIVDGLKVSDIGYLDPQNIKSVEILKDAASAAIYGAQAGNGVVLITTKTGTKGTSRMFFNSLYTIQSQARRLKMMNASQFKEYWMESGLPAAAFGNADTDWQKVVFTNGYLLSNTLGFEGANENGSLYTSLTYLNNDGMVVGSSDIHQRLTGQINADYRIQKWLKIGTTNSIERGMMKTVSANNFTTTGSVIGGAYFYDPTVPVFYENDADAPADMLAAEKEGFLIRNNKGKIYGSSAILQSNLWNPLGMIDNFDNKTWKTNVNGTLYADLMPFKGMTITSRLGYRLGTTYLSNYSTGWYWNTNQKMLHGQLASNMYHNMYYQWENFANYLLDIRKHSFSVMAGMQYASDRNESIGASTDLLASDAPNFRYLSYSSPEAIDNITGAAVLARNISYFGRLGWNYDEKYILQASLRADAFDASKLSRKNRWGYFPAVSAGWVVTNESFMKNLNQKLLSYLKLRASWGINGNVSSLSGYPYTTSLSLGGNIGPFGQNYYSFSDKLYTGVAPSTVLPNEKLSWEKSIQTDIGFDARFLRDRLSFGFDYFKKITTGLLGRANAPAISGTTTQVINLGKIENHGYEFELGWKDRIGEFSYSIDANLSTLHNEVLESPYGEGRLGGGGGFLTTATYFEKGYPIWYIRTYMVDHIDPLTGQPVYKTAQELGSDDGKAFAGSGIPDFTYGFTLNLAFKGLDLRVFGSGVQGSELYLALIRLDLPKCNLPEFMYEDRWTLNNTDATKPSPTVFLGGHALYATSDHWVFNSSYFKIKQIQLGYTLPPDLTKKAKISSLRIFASLENFFTFTKYPGNDPESMAGTAAGMNYYGFTVGGGLSVDQVQYPSMKQISFGVNVSF